MSPLHFRAAAKLSLPFTAYHQDEQYIPTRDRSLTAIWIAIDPVTAENGGLRVLPGSHRRGIVFPQREHDNDGQSPSFTVNRTFMLPLTCFLGADEYDFAKEAYGFDEIAKQDNWGPEIAVEMKPGSVLFFNGYLLHRSTKNRSKDQYRRVLTNHYLSGTSNLPWDAIDKGRKQSAAMADNRRVVYVTGNDPLERPLEPGLDFCFMRTCLANTPVEKHAELKATGGFPKSYADKKSVERAKM